jgi:hypothetical protein
MSTTSIIIIAVVGLIVLWFAYSLVWTTKQSLLGTWVAVLPDGERVTLQFEGELKGGTYKQLIKREGAETREFGHWIIKLADLRLIIMATDIKDHPRFGVDTQYWVTFSNKSQITIDGPDRKKWTFRRAADIARINFDAPRTAI